MPKYGEIAKCYFIEEFVSNVITYKIDLNKFLTKKTIFLCLLAVSVEGRRLRTCRHYVVLSSLLLTIVFGHKSSCLIFIYRVRIAVALRRDYLFARRATPHTVNTCVWTFVLFI